MTHLLKNLWWALLIRGIAAVIFGVLTVLLPGITLVTLIAVFAAYALIDGFAAIGVALTNRSMRNWVWYLIGGVISVIAGVVALFSPGVTIFVFMTLLAAWAITSGATQIAFAVISREETFAEDVVLILGGVLLVLFGVLLLLRPFQAVDALLTVLGFFAIFFGMIQIALAFQVRGIAKDISRPPTPLS